MKNSVMHSPAVNVMQEHRQTGLISFLLYFIFGINFNAQAQRTADTTKAAALYKEIIAKTKCSNDLSPEVFYALLDSYSSTTGRPSSDYNIPYGKVRTVIQYRTDTIYINRTDTIYLPTTDTIYMYQEIPGQEEVKAANLILQKIMEDEDLTALIQEIVKNMSSEEIKEFRKGIQDRVKDMDIELKQEQARKRVAELEAKRLDQKLAREAKKQLRKERKEAWDSLTKEEKKELVQEKVALIAAETGEVLKTGAIAVGAVVGLSLVAVGGIVAQGIIAIGKGIINTAKAIWNWIDDHFYIRIDLSCAQQRKIRKNRRYRAVVSKPRTVVKYRGQCPGW
jgi:hypothetical protein